jgi:hypothetical protein
MNLAAVTDWTTEWPFVDVFKSSRPWVQHPDGKVKFDEHGDPILQPGQSVETLMVREVNGHYPSGAYVATYEGAGTVDMSRYDVKMVRRQAPGRIESEVVAANGGIDLAVTASPADDPVRNLHVWMPGFENGKTTFHPEFLKRLEPFRVLRFMDWGKTNNSALRHWSERTRPTDPRYSTDQGVPLEVMIELANTCKADPWFCLPHLADDDFVRRFAGTVKERLGPGRKVYVEYSNEVWNGSFAQSRWAREQGQRLKLGDPEGLRFYSQRSVEVFHIWEEVFGGHERLVRVMGSQFANPWVSEQVLTWQDASKHTDALAVAPYFGYQYGDPKTADDVSKKTAEQLLDALDAEVEGSNRDLIRKQNETARKYQVQLIAYEGGQHLTGVAGAENNEALTSLFIAANRHPRMGTLYKKHFANWFTNGGGLYAVYNSSGTPTKWGSWGVLEYQDQPTDKAPKYQAILEFQKGQAGK